MMRRIVLAVFLAITTTLFAQTRLTGKVVSVEQQAIRGATITLANQGISTTTNDEGNFSLIP